MSARTQAVYVELRRSPEVNLTVGHHGNLELDCRTSSIASRRCLCGVVQLRKIGSVKGMKHGRRERRLMVWVVFVFDGPNNTA